MKKKKKKKCNNYTPSPHLTPLDSDIHEHLYACVFVCICIQLPNNLAKPLHAQGVVVLGTDPDSIDMAEDRYVYVYACVYACVCVCV